MSRLCLDTSAYSYFRRGDPVVAELLDRADWVGAPVITLGELRIGFLLGGRWKENVAQLEAFLANPVVEVLPVDPSVAELYAELTVAQRKAGRPVPANDLWIAATAIRHGATVLTYDAHFGSIERVGALVLSEG